MSAKGRLINCD